MVSNLKRLLLMFQFLTAIPLPVNLDVDEKDFGKGLIYAPIVGLIIGCIMAGSYKVFSLIFPLAVTAVFTVIIYIILTGGIHLDGLGDTFDGIFSNRPKERILEIMRDSRVGTNAVLAIACILLIYASFFMSIEKIYIIKVLILMPVAGRIGSVVGAGASTYARSGEGLGKSFIDYCNTKEIIIGAIIYSPVFWAIYGFTGLILCITAFITALALVKFLGRKIGGATGDVLGAVCELNQVFFLLTAYILIKLQQ